jgi:hypothetical protein
VYPIRTIVQKYRAEFEEYIARQDADVVFEAIQEKVPSAYELPILVSGARVDGGRDESRIVERKELGKV